MAIQSRFILRIQYINYNIGVVAREYVLLGKNIIESVKYSNASRRIAESEIYTVRKGLNIDKLIQSWVGILLLPSGVIYGELNNVSLSHVALSSNIRDL